jgi:NTE family protein
MLASSQMMQMSIVDHAAAQQPQVALLRPPVDHYRALDFLKTKEILAETAALRDEVKHQIDRFLLQS